jgi:hypothetical protein
MSTALWATQIFAALVFLMTGTTKLVVPRERLARRMHWAADWPRWRIKLLGFAEVAGAAGLILPAATGIAPVLTPIAAVCLALLMAGAIATHRRLHENVAPAAVVALICVGVAVGHITTSRTHSIETQNVHER